MMREKVVCCYKFALWLAFGKFVRNLLSLFYEKEAKCKFNSPIKRVFFFLFEVKNSQN